jgi:hypothetical protein
MTRVAKAVAIRRARARRDRWARAFRPDKVLLLLIAEAPPPVLHRYLYFPIVPTRDSLFREVARAVLSAEPTRKNKRELLKRLMNHGVFLIDAVQEPVTGPYRIYVGRLIARVRRLQPEKVIVVGSGVFDRISGPLRDAGASLVPIRIPIPSSGQQVRFHQAFKRAQRYRFVEANGDSE